MHPVLFHIGEMPIGTYALMTLLGLLAGVTIFAWLAGRDGHDRLAFVEMGLWLFIVGILSAKLFGAALAFDPEDPKASVLHVIRFGGHFYIGFLAAVAYLVWALRKRGVPLGRGLDYLVPGIALGHAFGRLGCLFAGCCWGEACDLPWAITFTSVEAHEITGVPLNVPLHPTQVYELLVELAIFGVLLVFELRKPSFAGRTFLAYVLLYCAARFGLETLRDDPRGSLLGLSTSQLLCSVSFVVAAVVFARAWRRHRDAPAAARKTKPPRETHSRPPGDEARANEAQPPPAAKAGAKRKRKKRKGRRRS